MTSVIRGGKASPRFAAVAILLSALAACAGDPPSPEPAGPSASHHAAAAAADPPVSPLRSGERFVDLTAAKPYTPTPPNGGTDEYRCMIIDPKLTREQYLTGVQFQPQNAAMSHHTITFVVPPREAAAARAKDAQTPEEGWTCFGDLGLDSSTWADTWTPGAKETLLSPGLGYRMEPGGLLVLQIHYNLLGSGGKPAGTDQSGVRLRVTDGTAETVALDTATLAAPIELPCLPDDSGPLCDRDTAIADVRKRFGDEAGAMNDKLGQLCGGAEAGNTQSCDLPIPGPMTVYATRGHMHLLGRSITVELNPGTPKAHTLLDVPSFNFDDQALHVLDKPVDLKAGDTLRVSCTHDANLRRQLPQLKTLPPRYVVWGEGTSDEMCLGLLTVSTR